MFQVNFLVVRSTQKAYKVRTHTDPWHSYKDRYMWMPKSVVESTSQEPAKKDILGNALTYRTIITGVSDWWYLKNSNKF